MSDRQRRFWETLPKEYRDHINARRTLDGLQPHPEPLVEKAPPEPEPEPKPEPKPEDPLTIMRRVYAETLIQYRSAKAQASSDPEARKRAADLATELRRLEAEAAAIKGAA